MTQILEALSDISADYDALLCDLWGCVHNGVTPFASAVKALQDYRATGGKVVLLTNAPRPAPFVAQSLARLGVPQDAYDLIVSSGDAARDAMFAGAVGQKIYHLGPEKDLGFFDIPAEWAGAAPIARVALEEAEGIVCTGPFFEDTETPEDYRATFLRAKAMGLKLLCANPDIVVDLGDKRIYCAGALAALYEEMGGEALYFGKPHPPIYELARRRLASLGLPEDARLLAIGDGINTDIAGATGESIDAIFISSGLGHDQFGPDLESPDAALLASWLTARQQDPRYTLGRLR